MRNTRLLLALLLAANTAHVAAAELQAYAGAVGGQASGNGGTFDCATSGPTIGNGWSAGLSLPTEGIAFCHLTGGVDNQVSSSGPLNASQSVIGPTASGQFIGAAAARADYGRLGVAASGSKAGATSNFNFDSAAGFARFQDELILTNPAFATGTPASVSFSFHIEGSMSSASNAPFTQQADVALGLRVNTGGVFDLFRATLINDQLPFVRGGSSGVPGGFIGGPGSLSGAADITSLFGFDIQWGVPFTLEVALRTLLNPCCFGTSQTADFFNTARLSGIAVNGPGGPITDFLVSSASGTHYSAAGVAAVPAPGSLAMLAAGLAALGLRRRRARFDCGAIA